MYFHFTQKLAESLKTLSALFYLSAIPVRWKPEILGSFFNVILETDAEKIDWLKIWLLVKNPQFLSNQADLQRTLPTHELKIVSKFHKNWKEIVDYLVTAKF